MARKTKQQKQLDALQATVERLEVGAKDRMQARCRHEKVNVRVFLHDRDNNDPYRIPTYPARGKCWVAELTCVSCGKELTTGKLDVRVGCEEE